MEYQLKAITEAGRKFVELAEQHAEAFRARAAAHDRAGTFPFENFVELQRSGFMAAGVPPQQGGLGVESVHDLMVGMSRLARGDASTAIAANMHIAGGAVVSRMLRRSRLGDDVGVTRTLEQLLAKIGSSDVVMCFPTTEQGTDLASPFTEITPVSGGYQLNGRKIFGTIAPAASLFFPSVRIPNGSGGYLTGIVMVERGAPGLEIGNSWDALGMRASGSHDVTFRNCFIAQDRVFGVRDNYGKVGRGFAAYALNFNLPLIASFLGIAEEARDIAVKVVNTQRKGMNAKLLAERVPIQQLVAEMEIDICACRALIDRLGHIGDAFTALYAETDAPHEEANAVMKEVQCVKYTVNRKAIEVVDHAMTVCGGMAYMNAHPLSRLYRDSRAGPFMQPFSPCDALEYIGKVTLGVAPILDR